MPPRLSKRQIREQEELAALDLKSEAPAEKVEEEFDDEIPAAPPRTGGFAAVRLTYFEHILGLTYLNFSSSCREEMRKTTKVKRSLK